MSILNHNMSILRAVDHYIEFVHFICLLSKKSILFTESKQGKRGGQLNVILPPSAPEEEINSLLRLPTSKD